MDVSDLRGKTALVTGAGSGIGRASALAFARRGADLEICDISPESLQETAAALRALGRGDVHAERVDVADRDQMEAWAAAVHERVPAVDLLMNNAGVAIGGGFLYTSLDDWDWILGVNLRGVVHGCHFFVPRMVERGAGGHVVNVGSVAGFVAAESLSAYCTTKFGVVGLSEALSDELHPRGIGVTCVCPGFIDTSIARAAKIVGPDLQRRRNELIAALQRRPYGPDHVAESILRAVQRDRPFALVTAEARIFYALKRISPRLLTRLGRAAGQRLRRRWQEIGPHG